MVLKNRHVDALCFEGLSVRKIPKIIMNSIFVSFVENVKTDVAAMSTGVEKSSKRGFFARNIARLILNNVQIKSRIGERMWLESRLYDTKNAY